MDVEIDVDRLSQRRAMLAVRGRLDAVTAAATRARIQTLIEEGRVELACDLSAAFLDSSGLSVLVSSLKAARERGGFLRVARLNEQVGRILKLTRLDRVFELYPSIEAAFGVKPRQARWASTCSEASGSAPPLEELRPV